MGDGVLSPRSCGRLRAYYGFNLKYMLKARVLKAWLLADGLLGID
jgi:hypothetical protein